MAHDGSALAWFRRDLRLADNPAWAAATAHRCAVPVVVLQPRLLRSAGPHRRSAYLAAIAGLEATLRERGAALNVAVGDPAEVIPRLAAEVGAATVTVNADVTSSSARRDLRVADALPCPLDAHWGTLVHPPGSVLTRKGALSQVFTAFWRRWQTTPLAAVSHEQVGNAPAAAVTTDLHEARQGLSAACPDILEAQPAADTGRGPAWPHDRAVWSEGHAAEQLAGWLEQADGYDESRDGFADEGTSRLSAALRFGVLSPRSVAAEVGVSSPGRTAFVRQLAWRDWYAHLAFENPHLASASLRPAYDRIAWASSDEADRGFAAWTKGRTGYPIVDAAMRQLTATGWLHGRLRMVAASFLVKDLLIDWRRGERWFRHLLVDGDLAQNAGNWQWVAGTGPDAAPYFRIFNPVAQSRRFDPEGAYLRRWLPELAALGRAAIHAPWEAGPLDLAAARVTLGVDYPEPIVEHADARQRTLRSYQAALADAD